MKSFTVVWTNGGLGDWEFFQCNAVDIEDAEEQCSYMYPHACVWWVNEGEDNFDTSFAENR